MRVKVLVVFCLLCVATHVFAQEPVPAQAAPQPLRLTLAGAIQMALQTGTQAQLARTQEERARIAEAQGFENLLPQADTRFSKYSQSINLETFGFSLPGQPPVIGPFPVTDANVTAAMQLFNLAALREWQALRAGTVASRYEVEQADNDVAQAVARLYVLVQRATAQIASREANVALFQRLLKMANDEFQAGTGTRLDVAQATLQVQRAQQALLVAQNDRATTALALLNTIGAPESSDVVITDPIPNYAAPPSPDTALSAARANRPELRAMEERYRSAHLAVVAAEERRLPSINADFEGDYNGNHANDLKWTRRIAGNIVMPIFHADINNFIANARANLHEVEIQRNQRDRDVEQDVRRSVFNLQNAVARVAVANENVRVAEEALTVARDRREAGYGSPVEVDRAEDNYREAHEDLISAQADAAAAHFELLHATGEIHNVVGAAP